MPGRRRAPQKGTRRESALAAENERLQREVEARLEQLERERDFVAKVVDSTATLFCVLEPTGEIVRFNKALGRLSGLTGDDVRGQLFWDVFVAPRETADVRRRIA